MTKPSEADSDHGVDQKLDSLISRIQLLGGEGKRPAQASLPVSGDGRSSGSVAPGEVPRCANAAEGQRC